ncbi:CC0125/CC1285 family lipoprotein [Maricaulis sp. CAU 1757]
MITRVLTVLAAVAALGACASPTPYQAADGYGRGYSEYRIEQNRFRVSFDGNSLTDRETVETYLLFRAAELTLEHGYDHFIVIRQELDRDTRVTPSHYSGFPVRYAYFHPRYGWITRFDPFWDDVSYRETTQYEASAEIIMASGPKPPNDPYAFTAREVIDNIGPNVVRPPIQ